MKKLLFVLIALIVIPFAHAAELKNWDIDISLSGRSSQWTITMNYDESVKKSDYYVLNDIFDVSVFADDKQINCAVSRRELGTSIFCENISTTKIVYKFSMDNSIDIIGDLRIFRYRFPIIQSAGNFSLTVRLPLGSYLIDQTKLSEGYKPFEPDFGKEGSDGRKIFVKWSQESPKVGDSISSSVIYEELLETSPFLIPIIVISLIIIFLVIFFYVRKRFVRDILPVLTPGERRVMEILLKEKKPVDQRQIVKETDYSKAKVSRIIQDLVARGLVEKKRKGRTNLIMLKKRKNKEDMEKDENKKIKL